MVGEVILGAVWLVIGGGLVWHFVVSRRRKQPLDSHVSESAEKEHAIRQSRRVAGNAHREIRHTNFGDPGTP